jgi:hypothetical protein
MAQEFVNLPDMFLKAQQAKSMQQQSRLAEIQAQMEQEKLRLQGILPQARARYFSGDPSQLQKFAPMEFQKLQQGEADLRETLVDVNKKAAADYAERAKRTSSVVLGALSTVEKNPGAWEPTRARIIDMARRGVIDLKEAEIPIETPTADEIGSWKTIYSGLAKSFGERKVTNDMADVAAAAGIDLRDPGAFENPDFLEGMKKLQAGKIQYPEDKLRKEFEALRTVQNAHIVAESYSKILHASDNAQGHMAMVFAFMKMLDVGSVVRESEQAQAMNAAGLLERAKTQVANWQSGDKLSPEQFRKMKEEARKIYAAEQKVYQARAVDYQRMAKERGLNPNDVVLPVFERFERRVRLGSLPKPKDGEAQQQSEMQQKQQQAATQAQGTKSTIDSVQQMRARGMSAAQIKEELRRRGGTQ